MILTPSQIDALSELEDVWPNASAVIIGATALAFYYDMRWRQTADVDLVVALELEDFPGALLDRPGWKQHPKREHEFTSPQGARLDLLPAGPQLIAAGSFSWSSGHTMSLAGMDLAFDHAESHNVSSDRSALVAPPPVVCLLKMISYCERPVERERDLADIAHLLADYVGEDSDRRFDEALGQEFELAPAYLLGIDVGRVAMSESHNELIRKFLRRVEDPDSVEHAVMRRNGPNHWRAEDALSRLLEAFRSGLAA